MLTIRVRGLKQLVKKAEALGNIDFGAAAERAAERTRAEVSPGVPVQTGALRRSGRVERSAVFNRDEARLLWDDLEYAPFVEDRVGFFEPVVEEEGPGFLKDEMQREVSKRLADA